MKISKRASLISAIFLLATAIAGCSNSLVNHYACPQYEFAAPRLVSPAPGSAGVPIDVGVIDVTQPADGTFSMQGTGAPFPIGPVSAIAPAPSASPGGELQASNRVIVPTLSSNVTYTVFYAAKIEPGCGSHETSGTVGTFTTQ